MELQFTPGIQARAHTRMTDAPPSDRLCWPGISCRHSSHGNNHICSQRLTGDFFRAMRIHVTLTTATQLVPVVQQPTVAIAFLHQGFAAGTLSGVEGVLHFREGHYYIPLLLPGDNQESLLDLNAGIYDATVILIEKKREAVFLKLFPKLASALEKIRIHNSKGLPYPPSPITPAINDHLLRLTRYDKGPDLLEVTVSYAVYGLILALNKAREMREALNQEAYAIYSYLSSRLGEAHTVAATARVLCMSEQRLLDTIKQCFGITFKQYLIRMRMERAQQLLCNSRMQIQEIALELGYAGKAVFSAAFRLYTNSTPTAYRAAIHNIPVQKK